MTGPSDRIELRGLQVMGICGVLPEERLRPQPLEIDVDIEADLTVAGSSDRLGDTVDYAALTAEFEQTVSSGRFTLLEHLAQRLAEVALAHARVESVTVSVRKLRPAVAQQLATSGVRITRTR